MKLQAQRRLTALTDKQQAIDFNKNGKVDGDDLKKLRNGKKPLTASPRWHGQVKLLLNTFCVRVVIDGEAVEGKVPLSGAMSIGSKALTSLGKFAAVFDLNVTITAGKGAISIRVEAAGDVFN